LHGLGDTGHGWSTVCATDLRLSHVKYICPHAPSRPVTLNLGMQMPAWFDVFGLTPDAEEDEDGINESVKIVHSMIDEEIRNGIPAERIIIAGFSMGGALALYAGLTYDKPLAGIVGLSSFLVQRDKIPGIFFTVAFAHKNEIIQNTHDFQNHTANKNAHILMGHGDADFVVPRTFGEMTAQFIQTFDPNIHIKIYPGMAHSSCPEVSLLYILKKFIFYWLIHFCF
uniref:palmitoyl-protein hydrolase n=1 Tax=Dracunculus medinensis TaxID=318479 RepID=A0A0N4U5J4_DRAME